MNGCPFSFLQPYRKRVEKSLEELCQNFTGNPLLKEASTYALLGGGRRFRPTLALMIGDELGGDAMDAALAIECFHTASLVADDLPCMDDEDERRCKAALHVKYDEATALLVTYSLISEGYRLVSGNSLAVENASLNTGMNGASGGQLVDISPTSLDVKLALEMIRQKTATFFEIAFVFGWLFGGGEKSQLDTVKKAANHFGMAFQLLDDIKDRDEDEAMGRSLNLALLLGSEGAKKQALHELDSFKTSMKHLGLFSPKWEKMGELIA